MNAPQRDSHVQEELLQRYFDGDLQGAPAESVAQHISACEDCKQRHVALGELHKLIIMSAETAALDIDFERAFANIERGTRERPAPGLLERLSVWWRDLVEQRPEQLWAPAVGAAVAAALLTFVLGDGGSGDQPVAAAGDTAPALRGGASLPPPRPEKTMLAEAPAQPPAVPQGPTTTVPPEPANTEVEQVDFGGHAGTVYEIALADGRSTPVVWINDATE